MSIKFVDKSHKYFNTSNNREYYSVTRFLHLFEEPFDADGISKRVALREGISQQEVLDNWNKINKEATEKGTKIHALMEDYFNFNKKDENYKILYDSFENAVSKDVLEKAESLHSEKLLWNDEYELAGTADLIIDYPNNEFSIGDFKTNKKFLFYSPYGVTMKEPINHLSSCQYNLYSLQLSLYAYMYSILTGKKVKHLFLLHCNDIDKGWQYIPCNYLKYEIIFMLKYYDRKIKNI